nr:hypothetical protein [Escherichia coli]
MNERLKTHSKTQKKSADLVSNKLRIGVFQRYQMKCKSVSKKSPRYTTQVARLVKIATKKIITNVSGIAHLLVGLDSVIADIAQIFPCTKQSGKYAK